MSLDFARVLIVSPHTDDGELGAGGTIARLVESGSEVHYVALSTVSNLHGMGHGSRLAAECSASTAELGIRSQNTKILDFPARNFDLMRQDILDELITLRNLIEPSLVIGPNIGDVHQDHAVVAAEVSRAFKFLTTLRFDTYWNISDMKTNFFVKLSKSQLQKKIKALGCYKSQLMRPYMAASQTESLARVRGLQSQSEYAEAFTLTMGVH